MPNIIGEQRPRPSGTCGPFFYQGTLTANVQAQALMSGSNQYPYLIPMVRGGLVLGISGYRNSGGSAGDITVQLGVVPAGSPAGAAPTPISGATFTAPAAGGPGWSTMLASPYAFAPGDALALLLTTATGGTAMLTANVLTGAAQSAQGSTGGVQSEAQGVTQAGLLHVSGFTTVYPNGESANIVYPFICNGQPNAAPSSTLSAQAYYWVAPLPGLLVSAGVVGVSTPGTTTNGAVCQLIRNNSLYGGGFNLNSFAAKNGVKYNLPFAAGDYFGLRYGCPYSGNILLTAALQFALTLPT